MKKGQNIEKELIKLAEEIEARNIRKAVKKARQQERERIIEIINRIKLIEADDKIKDFVEKIIKEVKLQILKAIKNNN